MSDEQELGTQAIQLTNTLVFPMVLKTALELDIIDTISAAGDAFMSPSQIANSLPTKNPQASVVLERILNVLASHSILKCSVRRNEKGEVERLYGAAPLCKFFLKNQDGGSVAPLFVFSYDRVLVESWYHLKDFILEGGGFPFERLHGMSRYEYFKTDDTLIKLFNQAMATHTNLLMAKVVDIYKGFDGVKVLVDVGGGIGQSVSIICSKYPHIKAINFDLPHVVAEAPSYLGVEHVGGDMLECIPKGDAVFMKWMLCGWGDEDCIKILKNCCEALPHGGKVIMVDSILPEAPDASVSSKSIYDMDVCLLNVSEGGKQRTHKEFEALALRTGFTSFEVICHVYNMRVMEFHKG